VLVLRWLLSYARRKGIDRDGLLHDLRIAPSEVDDPNARLPEATMRRAWAAIATACADEAIGLHIAQHADEGQFEVLDYAMSFSRTLREALERLAHFYRLASDDVAIQVIDDGERTRIVRQVSGTDAHSQDAFFAIVVDRFRSLSGDFVQPLQVSFEHAPYAEREFAAFFGCPARFARARSELVFASSDLERPVTAAKPKLAEVLDRYAAELVTRLPAPGSYDDRVLQVVGRLIQRGSPTLEAIARELHASPRTVQRRLSEMGTTYTRVVDDARRQLAMRYIESPQLSITQIAFLLGYQDDSSFRRAFKGWTGKSPTEVRHH
jgi:AraC-like DNA-binding protein